MSGYEQEEIAVNNTAAQITQVCDSICNMLIEKNIAYGNSFADPINIFAGGSPEAQLYVRIDDKLNRIKKGHEYPGDDTLMDLIGYLILLVVLRNGDNKQTT